MVWLHVFLLSLLAVPITLAAIFGVFKSKAIEMVLWLVAMLAIAWELRYVPHPLVAGLVCGFLLGLWQHVLQTALWDTYAVKNPKLGEQIAMTAEEKKMTPRKFMLVSGPMVGIVYAVVVGALAWFAARI